MEKSGNAKDEEPAPSSPMASMSHIAKPTHMHGAQQATPLVSGDEAKKARHVTSPQCSSEVLKRIATPLRSSLPSAPELQHFPLGTPDRSTTGFQQDNAETEDTIDEWEALDSISPLASQAGSAMSSTRNLPMDSNLSGSGCLPNAAEHIHNVAFWPWIGSKPLVLAVVVLTMVYLWFTSSHTDSMQSGGDLAGLKVTQAPRISSSSSSDRFPLLNSSIPEKGIGSSISFHDSENMIPNSPALNSASPIVTRMPEKYQRGTSSTFASLILTSVGFAILGSLTCAYLASKKGVQAEKRREHEFRLA